EQPAADSHEPYRHGRLWLWRRVLVFECGRDVSGRHAGVVNPDVTQTNVADTICKSGWTATIRPSASYTNALKREQLEAPTFKDKTPAHYQEDHFISLELGGHPRDPKNLWPEMWGTPSTPLTARGPFPSYLVGAKTKDRVENALHKAVCNGTLTLEQ